MNDLIRIIYLCFLNDRILSTIKKIEIDFLNSDQFQYEQNQFMDLIMMVIGDKTQRVLEIDDSGYEVLDSKGESYTKPEVDDYILHFETPYEEKYDKLIGSKISLQKNGLMAKL